MVLYNAVVINHIQNILFYRINVCVVYCIYLLGIYKQTQTVYIFLNIYMYIYIYI